MPYEAHIVGCSLTTVKEFSRWLIYRKERMLHTLSAFRCRGVCQGCSFRCAISWTEKRRTIATEVHHLYSESVTGCLQNGPSIRPCVNCVRYYHPFGLWRHLFGERVLPPDWVFSLPLALWGDGGWLAAWIWIRERPHTLLECHS